MNLLKLIVIGAFLTLPSVVLAGQSYYVDANASGGGDGSFERPFKTIEQVNSHQFSTGDDVYFQAGDTWFVSQVFIIDWEGTKNDPVVIGAYSGKNQFSLNGKARPIFDAKKSGGSLDMGLVRYATRGGDGYVHIRDIQVQNTIGYGVEINGRSGGLGGGYVTNCRVENVYTKNTASMGIEMMRTHNSEVINCTVVDSNQDQNNYIAGDGIDINAGQKEALSNNNTVRGCTVIRAYEGIGAYKGARNTIIENNTVIDCGTFYIYSANSRDGIIRNNIVYATRNARAGANSGYGIIIDNEGHNPNITLHVTGGYEIYGNKIAGMTNGIGLLNNGDIHGIYQRDNYVHDNIIVDCKFNIKFQNNSEKWANNRIVNNYSFVYSDGMNHVSHTSLYGVSWSGNYFNSAVKGDPASGAKIGQVELVKKSGWRQLALNAVTDADFNFSGGTASSTTLKPPTGVRIVN